MEHAEAVVTMRVLLVAVLLALVPGLASAERKVDWSQYLEKPGDRPAPRTTPVVAEPEAKPGKKIAKQKPAKKKAAAKRKPARRR